MGGSGSLGGEINKVAIINTCTKQSLLLVSPCRPHCCLARFTFLGHLSDGGMEELWCPLVAGETASFLLAGAIEISLVGPIEVILTRTGYE